MSAKALKLDSLDLDLENPRIKPATNQRDAMQKIIAEQKVKLVNLAESIAGKGLNPSNRLLVLRSDRVGRFVVLEGNRRVLCAKLLKNPSLIDSLVMPDAFKKRLQNAAQNFNIGRVEPVSCFEVSDRAEGNDWIRQRHIGEDNGRGVVDWSPVAISRFTGRDPALQALDFVLEHGDLSENEVEQINSGRFISTLDRLLSTPSVRKALGFEVAEGKLYTLVPADEAIKPLKRIVLDLASKQINVNDVKTKDQQDIYIQTLQKSDRPDFSKATSTPVAIDKITQRDFTAKHAPPTKQARISRMSPRTSVVAKTCKLKVDTPKIAEILEELRLLQLGKHKHAIAVLLRVFLELSVDQYLTKVAKFELTVKTNGHKHEKQLSKKVKEAIDHMVSMGSAQKDFLGVVRGLSDANHPFSIDTLHAYIHNPYFTPIESTLTAAWDNAQPFFERLWP